MLGPLYIGNFQGLKVEILIKEKPESHISNTFTVVELIKKENILAGFLCNLHQFKPLTIKNHFSDFSFELFKFTVPRSFDLKDS